MKPGEKFYNEKIVYIKFVCISITLILIIINHSINIVERSSGIFSLLFVVALFGVCFVYTSYRDIKKVRSGNNDKILERGEIK